MKKTLLAIVLSLLLAIPTGLYAADTAITGLDADTSPTTDDLVVTVDNPGAAPANKKVTLGNFAKGISTLFLSGLTSGNGDTAGGFIKFLEDTDNGTDYGQITGAADAGTNPSFTFSGSPANTEDFTISLGANDNIVTFSSSTGAVSLVGLASYSLGATGVKLTGSNGSLTILGLGDGQDEDVKIDLNSTANSIDISSPASSATQVSLGTLNMVTTGTISGKVPMITKSDDYTLGSDSAQEAYGYMVWISGDSKIVTLPAVAAGMSVCVYSTDATAKVVDPNGNDGIKNGTAARNADGHKITSGGTAGDFVCLVADSADGWTVLGKSGTWTDE